MSSSAKRKIVVWVLVGLWGAYFFWPEPSVRHGPGVLVPDAPGQSGPSNPLPWTVDSYKLKSLADLSLTARVLSKARYYVGRETDLSRYDLALGWGPMSDEAVLDRITISQSSRWYRWRYRNPPPISQGQIIRHSGNFHIIAATDQILAKVKKLRRGDLVRMEGRLVHVSAADGWRWKSSVSRTDTGARSCELMWVEALSVVNPPGRGRAGGG
ncbi:MAG: hypothetical protein OER86_11305 [Phycisphaerae bacterium]|nr:hypothetical protein [Phycisphaerae bacterium]